MRRKGSLYIIINMEKTTLFKTKVFINSRVCGSYLYQQKMARGQIMLWITHVPLWPCQNLSMAYWGASPQENVAHKGLYTNQFNIMYYVLNMWEWSSVRTHTQITYTAFYFSYDECSTLCPVPSLECGNMSQFYVGWWIISLKIVDLKSINPHQVHCKK